MMHRSVGLVLLRRCITERPCVQHICRKSVAWIVSHLILISFYFDSFFFLSKISAIISSFTLKVTMVAAVINPRVCLFLLWETSSQYWARPERKYYHTAGTLLPCSSSSNIFFILSSSWKWFQVDVINSTLYLKNCRQRASRFFFGSFGDCSECCHPPNSGAGTTGPFAR